MTTRGGEIGNVSVKDDRQVDWAISNFFSYEKKDVYYDCPYFNVSETKWDLLVYPNGQTANDSVGWISFYLRKEGSGTPPIGATFSFGLKKADGKVEDIRRDATWIFEKGGMIFGYPKFLLRWDLQQKRSEMAPSDVLTLTCTLQVNQTLDFSTRLDALSHNLADMFTSQRDCDVTLKVQNETFSVHKFILSARSPVFAAMFEIEMKEKNTGIADIVDCDPEAFRHFLTYLYSGKIENLKDKPIELYKIADKYDVRELKSACLLSTMSNISLENVLDVAVFGHQSDIEELKKRAQKFFNENFQKIVTTVEWETLMKDDYLLANELLKEMAPNIKLKD